MKKLLSTLLLAAAVPATMLAKPVLQENFVSKFRECKAPVATKQASFIKADTRINPALLMDHVGTIVKTDTIPYPNWPFYFITGCMGDANVMTYEPITDAVYIAQNFSTLQRANQSTSETRGKVNVLVYGNGGKTFTDTIQVYNKKDTIAWAPSIAILNTTGTTDPRKLNIFISNQYTYGRDPIQDEFKEYELATFAMYNGSSSTESPLRKSVFEKGPANSPNYSWSGLAPMGYIEENEPYYIVGGPLFVSTGGTGTHGRYGMAIFQNSNTQEEVISQFPTEFVQSLFKEPTATSHSNSPVLFGKDEEGTLYGFINNCFVDNVSRRLPAVAKSEDGGITWSPFDKMPWSVFDNYVQNSPDVKGAPTEEFKYHAFLPFEGVDFTVLGKDRFSYIGIVYVFSETNQDVVVDDIVEVYKENGEWGMRKIEDMRTRYSETQHGTNSIRILYQGSNDPVKDKLVMDAHSRGNELELATTKDKKYIIAKWLDNVYNIDAEGLKEYLLIDTLETSTVMYDNATETGSNWGERKVEGYIPTAIYMKYREIGTSNWSETIRLTNDERYHLHTHMPDVVPSLSQIPMLTSVSMDDLDFSTDTSFYINRIPIKQRNMVSYQYRNTLYQVFDTSRTNSVNINPTISKEAVSVFPNPTTGDFTVKFNASANSTVEIFNTLGEKIMDVKGNTANAAGLNNGIYLVKVTNNGAVTSTLFTVAK